MSLSERVPNTASTVLSPAYRKIALRLIPLLFLCYVAAYLDRINVSFAKLQMESDLQFSEAVFGLGAGLFFVGYIFFEVPSNLVLERVGARIWIARIMISWGVLSGLTMFVQNELQFYLVRFLLGVAEAGFVPGVLLYLTYWFPSARRARFIGFFMMGIPAAALLGGPLSGWIMTAFDEAGSLDGWQWLFLLEAIPTVVLGVIVLALLPRGIEEARWLSTAEKGAVATDLAADAAEAGRREHNFGAALRDRRVWWLGIIDMSFMTGTYAISFWLPTLLRGAGAADTSTIGWLTAIPSAAALLGLLVTGFSSDRFRERRWHLLVPMLIGAAGLALSTQFTDNLAVTVLIFTIANAGIVATYPVFWCLPSNFLTGKAAAGGIALITSMGNLGGFLATYILGWLADISGTATLGLLLFASFLVVGAFLAYQLPAREVNR
ncbi:MAG TPA: MFS transporter [Acidimicrobiia bacterium]|nr:MFS transporter [Acidimicrobiia bacterium]